ncbi:MAG: hypothetical protein CL927_04775 [Deltaproteobacteria bacterium]|nr:hypothetical protein [Deltaproteobacteria bacterium]HCH62324.1 hypothetical protein [Deltaproteobacteria bacterium]
MLGPPRLAAMGVWEGHARAAVWSGRGAWHAAAPRLSWTLNGTWIGDGFDVAVDDYGTLDVEVRLEDGASLTGSITVADGVPVDVVRQVVRRPTDLSLASRLEVVDPDPRGGSADGFDMVRLSALRADNRAATTRWMLGAPGWSILELQAATADVVPAQVVYEDGEISKVMDGGAGIAPVLALSVDGLGHNGWDWIDVAFDVPGPMLSVQGHLFPISSETATDQVLSWQTAQVSHVLATLEADPDGDSPTGLRLVDVEAGLVLDADLAANPSPSCAPSGGGFELWAVAEGRCPVSELDGARVVLEL